LQLLSSTSDRADPRLIELINRTINWLQDFLTFYNNDADIEQSDPNNHMPSTFPARLETEKSFEDIMSEANNLGEYQTSLRGELQDKYHMGLTTTVPDLIFRCLTS
jgi:hypothetical protein